MKGYSIKYIETDGIIERDYTRAHLDKYVFVSIPESVFKGQNERLGTQIFETKQEAMVAGTKKLNSAIKSAELRIRRLKKKLEELELN